MIVFAIFYVAFLLDFFSKKQRPVSEKRTKVIHRVHISTLVLVIAILWMRRYGMSFRGYRTEEAIWWLFYFSALSILNSGSSVFLKGIRKVYYSMFLFFPILLAFLLFIPILGLSIVGVVKNEFFGEFGQVRYSDSHYRIERPAAVGVLGSPPEHVYLIVKKGIFEYQDQWLHGINDQEVMGYRITKKTSKEIEVETVKNKTGKYRRDTILVHLNN